MKTHPAESKFDEDKRTDGRMEIETDRYKDANNRSLQFYERT